MMRRIGGSKEPATRIRGAGGRFRRAALLALPTLALATGCADPYVPLTFAAIEIAGGDLQSAPVCTALPDPVVVKALDQFGDHLPGALIRFTSEEGTFSPTSALASADGRVSATFTLGPTPGSVRARALAWNDELVLDFTFTAEPDPPATLRRISGHNQSQAVGKPLANPLVARLLDACNVAVPDVSVTWTTTAGLLGSGQGVTDAEGYAQNTLITPDHAGTVTVTATATGKGSITYTATATIPATED